MTNIKIAAVMAGVLLASASAVPAMAQEDFYAGKTVTLVVGAPPTGSYAAYSQLLSRHLSEHIPGNPTIQLDFRGGGDGGIGTSQYMETAAPKDGTFVGITQQTIPVNQFIQPGVGNYDVGTWQWIGGMAPIRNMLAVWHTAPAQTVEEAKETPVRCGATSTSSPMYFVPHMMNIFLGTRFEVILGYDGIGGANLAMEQGETHCRGASWASVEINTPHYISDNLLRPLVVDGATRDPAIPDTPTLIELAPDEETRQVFELMAASSTFGRSFFVPAEVPEDRVQILRQAFEAAMQDEDLLADAAQQNISIELVSHAELKAAVEGLSAIPEAVVQRAADALSSD